MMLRSITTRSAFVRVARQQGTIQQRTFAISLSRQADLVQDIYLKELKAYKTPTMKPSDSQGHVQNFSMPKAPQSPEETNIANELKSYKDQQVEVEGQAASGETAAVEEDWFEEDEEEEHAPSAH